MMTIPHKGFSHKLSTNFRWFIRAIATAAHLYFDDIQWADHDSRDLIEAMIGDLSTSNILIVVCFREDHALLADFKDSREAADDENTYKRIAFQEACALPQTHIHVDCLEGDDVNGMVSDLLKCNKDETKALSNVIQKKTFGNVFYIIQFIDSLQSRGLLKHCIQRDTWEWNVD